MQGFTVTCGIVKAVARRPKINHIAIEDIACGCLSVTVVLHAHRAIGRQVIGNGGVLGADGRNAIQAAFVEGVVFEQIAIHVVELYRRLPIVSEETVVRDRIVRDARGLCLHQPWAIGAGIAGGRLIDVRSFHRAVAETAATTGWLDIKERIALARRRSIDNDARLALNVDIIRHVDLAIDIASPTRCNLNILTR